MLMANYNISACLHYPTENYHIIPLVCGIVLPESDSKVGREEVKKEGWNGINLKGTGGKREGTSTWRLRNLI